MKRAVWISLFVLFIYFLSYAGVQHSIDELATLSLSESLLHGSMAVNRMEWEQERYPPQNAYGEDGNLYSKKGLGVVLAAAPFLLVGKLWPVVGAVQFTFLLPALVTAVTVFIFYLLVDSMGYSERVAALSALALGLGTLLWPYAQMLFSEPIAALGVVLALLGLVRFWEACSLRWLFITGVGGAFLILSRSANAILFLPFMAAAAICIFADWRRWQSWRRLVGNAILFGLPVVLTVLGTVLYNDVRFGTLLSYPRVAGEVFSTPLWQGVAGQLWSSGKGLVFYVPLTLMVFLSIAVDFRKMKTPPFVTAVFVLLIPIFFYGRWYDWAGGKAWGPRF